jgi:flagellar FliL protein
MAEAQEIKETKKSPKKLIIIISAVLLLIGGGAGGYFYMQKSAKPAHKEKAKEKHSEEEHKEEAEQDEKAEPDVFYDLSTPPLIVDFPAGSSAKAIKISISILLKGETGVAVLKKNDPMIRNNLLMAISSMGADKLKTTEGKQALRALMVTEISKVMEKMSGKSSIKDVYFSDFVMQ